MIVGCVWVSDWYLTSNGQSWREQVAFRWDDHNVCYVLNHHALFGSYNTVSLKQQSTNRNSLCVGTLSWFTVKSSLLFTPQCCVIKEEAADAKFIVFSLTRPGLELTIYNTKHYTIDAVDCVLYDSERQCIKALTLKTKTGLQNKCFI